MRKKKPPRLSREESLRCVAVPNRMVRVCSDADGHVRLFVPLRPPRWLGRFIKSAERERRIELDEVGSLVWRMCDGDTTVRQMIARLADTYKLNIKEAEVSLSSFLRTLLKKRLIVLALPQPPKDPGPT